MKKIISSPDAATGKTTATKISTAINKIHAEVYNDFAQSLNELTENVLKLNVQMEKQLIEIVNANGGLIRTDDADCKNTIFGYVYDDILEKVIEQKVLAVAVFEDNDLGVLLGNTYEMFDDDETDEQILEYDNWHIIQGMGDVVINVTLYNICENLWDYLDDENVNCES